MKPVANPELCMRANKQSRSQLRSMLRALDTNEGRVCHRRYKTRVTQDMPLQLTNTQTLWARGIFSDKGIIRVKRSPAHTPKETRHSHHLAQKEAARARR